MASYSQEAEVSTSPVAMDDLTGRSGKDDQPQGVEAQADV